MQESPRSVVDHERLVIGARINPLPKLLVATVRRLEKAQLDVCVRKGALDCQEPRRSAFQPSGPNGPRDERCSISESTALSISSTVPERKGADEAVRVAM